VVGVCDTSTAVVLRVMGEKVFVPAASMASRTLNPFSCVHELAQKVLAICSRSRVDENEIERFGGFFTAPCGERGS